MSNVIQLSHHRKDPEKEWESFLIESVDYLIGEWETAVRKNCLNEFFRTYAYRTNDRNYTSDLNAISSLENDYSLGLINYAPFSLSNHQTGWISAFKVFNKSVHTPEFVSEAQARCFALLLFLRLKTFVSR